MKKLSHKDIIVALGVLVAAVIIISSVYFKDNGSERNSMKITPDKKVKPAAILENVVRKFHSRTSF